MFCEQLQEGVLSQKFTIATRSELVRIQKSWHKTQQLLQAPMIRLIRLMKSFCKVSSLGTRQS